MGVEGDLGYFLLDKQHRHLLITVDKHHRHNRLKCSTEHVASGKMRNPITVLPTNEHSDITPKDSFPTPTISFSYERNCVIYVVNLNNQ